MRKTTFRTNVFLTALAIVFAAAGGFLQWQLIDSRNEADRQQAEFKAAMAEYQHRNVYYSPQAIVTWLRNRQNPAGYFVPNPDLIFEPSQLNANTLRATRYAITTLRELDALGNINRRATVEFVLSNYIPDVVRTDPRLDHRVYRHGPYAAFHTLEGERVGVRPTMDALIILEALAALDDPRIDLQGIRRFILAHQNSDGGFWDEHYPKNRKASCMKCTSFALRALGVIQRHQGTPFSEPFKRRVAGFVDLCRDEHSGSYGSAPGKAAKDVYNVFRAFITLWWLGAGDNEAGKTIVVTHMDVDGALGYVRRAHYMPDAGAFTRYRDTDKRLASLKATHLLVWLATVMDRPDSLDTGAIARFTADKESQPGEYGGDIYSTYSATGIFRKLGVPTTPLPEPRAPGEYSPPFPVYLPPLFFLLALATITLSYLSRKHELETINSILAQQASMDGLTGICNRLRFEALLKLEVERAKRYHSPLSVILFDADHFKEINDTHGHLIGDLVLKRLVKLVSDEIRDPDVVARWGGEEFVILAPGTRLQGASLMADKLRGLIERTPFEKAGHITCSFGVTEYRQGEDPDTFVERADRTLYRAKQKGRNRVCTE